MSRSTLPLSYCTNVHPGLSRSEIESGLERYTCAVAERVGGGLAAGLWLAEPVIREFVAAESELNSFAEFLQHKQLPVYTLNAFPFGNFHSERVKENVYLPDWTTEDRQRYTLDCARVLTRLLLDGAEGSISTVPLGFKSLCQTDDFLDRSITNLIETAVVLRELESRSGRRVRLAIEPEPLCVLETTMETLEFFARLFEQASARHELEAVREYIGVCYDVCHQSVEFEDVVDSIQRLDGAGIRINKVHITCAIEVRSPVQSADRLAALKNFIEPRYLHQTTARSDGNTVHRWPDLSSELLENPPPEFRDADTWRVHYHVPVDAESVGPLATTRPDLRRALSAVMKLSYAPHLEVETYTWNVLPDGERVDLVDGLTREIEATRGLLDEIAETAGSRAGA